MQILIYFEYAFPDNEEDEQALESLRMSALLNLSNCKLRTKQYDDVISFASQVRPECHAADRVVRTKHYGVLDERCVCLRTPGSA